MIHNLKHSNKPMEENQAIKEAKLNEMRSRILYALSGILRDNLQEVIMQGFASPETNIALPVSQDGVILTGLLKSLKDHGSPKEVLFITETGEKISLVQKLKTLNQDEVVNILLDSTPKE